MTMGPPFKKALGTWALYFLYFALRTPVLAQEPPDVAVVSADGEIGGNATIICRAYPADGGIVWLKEDTPLPIGGRISQTNTTTIKPGLEPKKYIHVNLTIVNVTKSDAGAYKCVLNATAGNATDVKTLDLKFVGKFVDGKPVKANASEINVKLKCVFQLYDDANEVLWRQLNSSDETETATVANTTRKSEKEIESVYTIDKVTNDNNGTYACTALDTANGKNITGSVDLFVYDKPEIFIDEILGVSETQLYIKWTTKARNSKILKYSLVYGDNVNLRFVNEEIKTNSTSFVINGLNKSTEYSVRLTVETTYNESRPARATNFTLENNPNFVPNISINGFSATSVTIGWAPPPHEIEHLVNYYELEARNKDGGDSRKAYHSRDSRNLPYMFDSLEPHSTYVFKVRACQDYTSKCYNWSSEMEAATLDGIPGRPADVSCVATGTQLNLTWQPPKKRNAEIKGYTMELTGFATYRDRSGVWKNETWGPLSRFQGSEKLSARFDDLQPNTDYTVRLSAMTRTRRRGEEAIGSCRTDRAPPDLPPRPRWRKILDNGRYLFKMYLPKASERNGPICCYRVYMVRMPPHKDLKDLKKDPRTLEVISYEEAHSSQPTHGAYITDIFTNDFFPADNELIMGDGKSIFNRSDPLLNTRECARCVRTPQRVIPPVITTEQVTTEARERRSIGDASDYAKMQTMADGKPPPTDELAVRDGALDSASNYTTFVQLIPGIDQHEAMYSDYINLLQPAPSPVAPVPSTMLEIALQATCALAALVLIIVIIFCVMQTRKSRKMPPHAHLEMNPIQAAIGYVLGHIGGRQQLGPQTPPDMPPIAKEDFAAAYAERHADSDYGFQKEFELLQMLSECIADRTTHASEARENQPKNRYPDIKAYDQTRVKLQQIDGIPGSDYINANYVMGYRESKQFICAQGPTETTVNDFWRMIWEHGLELIVMLTNLEEYSKVKCSKYWPDEVRGSRAFGAITVHHVSEKRYSDYIVRELKVTKQPTNSEGQPIVENNGVAKRNGDINQTSESAPTSPREKDSGESRIVRQYHFLMWKDFAAPEHPHSILKFIKRVNEAWSSMVGRPVVVHCSAGVGRTGTLVALDCLLDQLRATGHCAVFNTIAELRGQRNFLVQSQKQYVFVYRALVEYVYYGDTELPAARLKSAVDRLRNTPEGGDKCLMEHDFEKLLDSPVSEPVKSSAAGAADEVRARNRRQDVLPYDRHRVMLMPIPGRDFSTYINASFIEGYDNSEAFIITQDPLPNTIFDFWRMVSEQSVSTIVMLSELGEGKCPRYWDDGTVQYEHMSVQYEESESCPYYTRRQFRLTNSKSGHTTTVRHLQYQGWPTAPGHVPEVTRGLAELCDAAPLDSQPMLVHCHLGTERSALFVALCILICQLRTERRVDVSAVARKVRAQRDNTIDTFLQYEFLHRAILNYAELHNLLEDTNS